MPIGATGGGGGGCVYLNFMQINTSRKPQENLTKPSTKKTTL